MALAATVTVVSADVRDVTSARMARAVYTHAAQHPDGGRVVRCKLTLP